MRIKKVATYFFISFILFSCTKPETKWLEDYAKIKCAYITKVQQKDSAKNIVTTELNKQKRETEMQFEKYASKYENEIKKLENEIKQEQNNYMKKYREETEKHSIKYGHVSTPEYDKMIKQMEENRDEAMGNCKKQIDKIKQNEGEDAVCIQFKNKLNELDKPIKDTEEKINNIHKASIDSLQQLLTQINTQFKDIASSLQGEELEKFTAKRDSLKENPCNK